MGLNHLGKNVMIGTVTLRDCILLLLETLLVALCTWKRDRASSYVNRPPVVCVYGRLTATRS